MNAGLGKKAVLRLTPQETEYIKKFGICPEYHYDRLRGQYGSDRAGEIVNRNMAGIWISMKITHAIAERDKSGWAPAGEILFESSPVQLSNKG